jgi:arginyl-tRNA synthetase
MNEAKGLLQQKIEKSIINLFGKNIADVKVDLSHPENLSHGDLTTNIAMQLFPQIGDPAVAKNPRELAQKIVETLEGDSQLTIYFSKMSVEGPGFINFWLDEKYLFDSLKVVVSDEDFGKGEALQGKKIMVEYAHPNTHKEMHIGHMRTLITGEALCRIFEANRAEVFRANYQGDIGPHVAKAIWGLKQIMDEKGLSLSQVEKWSHTEKAHFLGEGYVFGSQKYEEHKDEINALNTQIYEGSADIKEFYEITRRWSLEYYQEFYERFYTKFDHLFFESDMAARGKKIVQENIGKVFKEDNGAVVFPGEEYGLHTRVFITSAGNPTYEGKEMANAYAEYKAFSFDLKMHVVASEQLGYFQVVIKALELLDPEKFKDKQYHLSMGMVQLTDRKMSSRTGDILTVDWLIDQVRQKVQELLVKGKVDEAEKETTIEKITIGAIKYSVLRTGTGQDVAFDIEKSVTLDGNSGPYIQYSYARTQSILAKAQLATGYFDTDKLSNTYDMNEEEAQVLRYLLQYPTILENAASHYAPNMICTYLFELAQKFNLFYQKHTILGEASTQDFRLSLTTAVGNVLKNGLNVLGIQTVEKM